MTDPARHMTLHDMLNVTRGRLPRFVHNFLEDAGSIEAAIRTCVADVKAARFPDAAVHGY